MGRAVSWGSFPGLPRCRLMLDRSPLRHRAGVRPTRWPSPPCHSSGVCSIFRIAPKHLKHPARKERHMVAKTLGVGLLLVFGLLNRAAAAETMDVTKDVKDAQDTVAVFKKADPDLSRFFKSSVGYAVFPTVEKGAVGIGGAPGPGVGLSERQGDGETTPSPADPGGPHGGPDPSADHFFLTGPGVTELKERNVRLS